MSIADHPNIVLAARRGVIGEVKAEMARKGITQERLGELTDRTQQYWSRRFTASVALDVDDFTVLSTVLNVPMWRFIPVDRPGTDDPRGLRYIVSPLTDSNRRPPLYIVDASGLENLNEWPAEAAKHKQDEEHAA